MDYKKLKFETRQIHAGLNHEEPTGSRGIAIYPTSAYRFKSCDYAANLFELSDPVSPILIRIRGDFPSSRCGGDGIVFRYGGIAHNLYIARLRR